MAPRPVGARRLEAAVQWLPWLRRLPSPRGFAVFGFGRFQISANEPLSSSSTRLAKIGAGKEGSSSRTWWYSRPLSLAVLAQAAPSSTAPAERRLGGGASLVLPPGA